MLTHERLLEHLVYDPEEGDFTWIKALSNAAAKLTRAGTINSQGYHVIRIDGRLYRRGRLAYFYMTGEWPDEIDHIDGRQWNDKWINLRNATSQQNKQNRTVRYDNALLAKGIAQLPSGRFNAYIKHNYVSRNLGTFDTLGEAISARKAAEIELFGEFTKTEPQIRLVD